ncbi:hypothetical protein BDA99DRAFT_503742 [Phascolomyces articulosus]|uniref:Uncharacterized protein n=1 Tax=Phascolomyces articulosus TaxID=60185 RepID=A0AAD5PGG8_9FUNG|nr:hypothetical protein BDA99DRAFT_503742 [Phascolomyces articulosus]
MKHPNSMTTKDYEYKVYDRIEGQPSFLSQSHVPIIVVMARHEGFQWNDDLFVSPFRREAGYTSQKSADRLERESRVSDDKTTITTRTMNTNRNNNNSSTSEEDPVIQIQLSDTDRDIWP